jgi:predicted metal-dependent HD superfamily phosphohydrolase
MLPATVFSVKNLFSTSLQWMVVNMTVSTSSALFPVTMVDVNALRQHWNRLWPADVVPLTIRDAVFVQLVEHYQIVTRTYHNLAHIKALLNKLNQLLLINNNLAFSNFEITSLQLAIWFHDAIYDPQRADNEQQSARYAARQLETLRTGIANSAGKVDDSDNAAKLPNIEHTNDVDHLDDSEVVDDLNAINQLSALVNGVGNGQIKASQPVMEQLAMQRTTLLDPALAREVTRLVLLTQRHETQSTDRIGQLLLDLDLEILSVEFSIYQRYAMAIRQEYHWLANDRYCQGRQQVLEKFLTRSQIYLTTEFAVQEASARQNIAAELAQLRSTGETFNAVI